MNDDKKPSVTNSETDSESGLEGVSTDEEKRKHEATLKIMKEKGLISDAEYQRLVNR